MISKEILRKLMPITKEEQQFLKGETNIDRTIYMENNGDTINSKKLLESGKIITIRPHTRFVHFPEHTHDFVEMVYMCAGETTHIINGETIHLHEGEFLFLSQNATQEILPAGENDIAVNFIILPQFFDVSLTMLGDEDSPLRKFIIQCLKGEGVQASYLHFKVSDILPIQNLTDNLLWTLVNNVPNRRKINEFTMGLLFLHLLNHIDRLNYKNEEENIIFQVLQYIENNYKDGSLTELANQLYYDFNALSKEIKKKTGKNYTELVQERRLSQACFLLQNTDMNIDKIAQQVGYDNISYFHRLFKNRYHISPKHYRNYK